MGHNNLKNVAVERARDLNEARETAIAVSQGTGSRAIDSLAMNGAQRRATTADGAATVIAGGRGKAAMGRTANELGDQIGRELRGMFEEVVSQPVPDRFLELLNRLESRTISPGVSSKSPRER